MAEFLSPKPCTKIVGPDDRGNPAACGKTPTSAAVVGFGRPDPDRTGRFGDLQYENFCKEHYPEEQESAPRVL